MPGPAHQLSERIAFLAARARAYRHLAASDQPLLQEEQDPRRRVLIQEMISARLEFARASEQEMRELELELAEQKEPASSGPEDPEMEPPESPNFTGAGGEQDEPAGGEGVSPNFTGAIKEQGDLSGGEGVSPNFTGAIKEQSDLSGGEEVSSHSPLLAFQQQSGEQLPFLNQLRARNLALLEEKRASLNGLPHQEGVSVIVVGSLGRHEATSGSDEDLLILARGEPRAEVRPSLQQVADGLEGGPRGWDPARDNTFGAYAFTGKLNGERGFQDSNQNFTRRMLLLIESDWLSNPASFQAEKRECLDSYLRLERDARGAPQYLLHELLRYWRTIQVDFVIRGQRHEGRRWGLRALKLPTSRQLTIVSALLPLLRCSELNGQERAEFLHQQFALPNLDRLADSLLHYQLIEQGGEILSAYQEVLLLLDQPEKRAELKEIRAPAQGEGSQLFQQAARLGARVQSGCSELLLSPGLRELSQAHLLL